MFGLARRIRRANLSSLKVSALSAMRIRGATSGCAALSANGIRELILPPEAKLVRIFADHDEMNQNLLAARGTKKRWTASRTVTAMMAENVGTPTTWLETGSKSTLCSTVKHRLAALLYCHALSIGSN